MLSVFKNNLWSIQLISLFIFYFILGLHFFISVLSAFIIYCLCGGWRFMSAARQTWYRDLKGLIVLFKIKYAVSQMKSKKIGIGEFFMERAHLHPNKKALIAATGDDVWTYSRLDAYSNQVANYLLEAGFQEGDAVALFMESRPIYVATWLGCAKAGIVASLINFNLRLDSLTQCITSSNSRAVIYGVELQEAIAAISDQIQSGKIPLYYSSQGSPSAVPSNRDNLGLDLDQLVAPMSKSRPPLREVNPNDSLVYIFTSGTTGMPKAAKISHVRYYMMSNAIYLFFGITENDINYAPLPLYHTAAGILGVGMCLIRGVTMVIKPKFSASKLWDECIAHNCTIVQYIGELCRYLLAQPERPSEKQHRLRLATGNGIRPQIWKTFQERFNIPVIAEFYGATESNSSVVNTTNRVGAVGFLSVILPNFYPAALIRVDEATGEPIRGRDGLCVRCSYGETGELVGKIESKDAMRRFDGYVNNESATSKKMISNVFKKGDRAFLSGDILVQDELGYLYFRDRAGDTYRWRGENVSTSEVEGILANILGLADCVVFGVEIPGTEGRAGMAAVADPQHLVDLDQLSKEMPNRLPPYARPVFLRRCQSIEMTGTFKMKKLDLLKVSFNPTLTEDPIYLLDSKTGSYNLMTEATYQAVMTGAVRF